MCGGHDLLVDHTRLYTGTRIDTFNSLANPVPKGFQIPRIVPGIDLGQDTHRERLAVDRHSLDLSPVVVGQVMGPELLFVQKFLDLVPRAL